MADLLTQLREALADLYRLERELGRGGMATVYLAQDIRHDRPVAVKVLHPELAASLGAERFQREIRMTARLQHPNILPVHDSGSAAGHLWYTMPYIDGETLRDRLDRERLLPIEEAVRITSEVADALGYAHEQGVVHRDIKPENILLSQGHALVADFGIARALQAGDQEGLTQTGVTVGTPAYMSPEQSVGDTVIDGRSDLYSLGCVLYEMLAGEPPYTGTSAQAIAAKRLFDPIPSARRLRETVPIQIDEALARALAKSAADRFSDTRTFGRALHETAVNRTVSERPGSGTRRANTRRILIGGSILTGVTILVLALVYAVHLSDSATGEANTLAVLPFKNLGPSADQYFADGLTEEVTSRLASLHGLGVISRTSSERYRGSTKPLRQIASELGANYILEGSVRWEKAAGGGSRIRVTPQLIRVHDDVHLWADRFDADLADVFTVQSEIAERVTGALGVALAPKERQAVLAKPTANLNAYDAYLRGNAASPPDFTVGAERIVQGFRNAAGYYREATRLDSTFASAWARLGSALTWLALYQVDPKENSLLAAAAIRRATALDPNSSEAHGTAGIYQAFIAHDMARAHDEFELSLAQRPNDADVLSTVADIEWYMRGPAGRSIPFAERAVRLDPSSNSKALVLARIYRDAGRYADAERLYDRVIERDPDGHGPYVMRAFLYLLKDGDTAKAKASIRAASRRVDSTALIISAVSTLGIGTWAALGMLDEPFQRALLTLQPSAFGDDTTFYGIVKGYAYRARGHPRESMALYDTAATVAERRRQAFPDDPGPIGILMWTKAVQGEAAEAYRDVELAYKVQGISYAPEKNAMLARVALFAGDTMRALSELESRGWGSDISVPWLCTDAFWNPIRSQPRFKKLVSGKC